MSRAVFSILIALTGMVSSAIAVAKDDHAKPVDFQREPDRELDRDPGGGSNTGTGGGLAEAHIAYSYLTLDKFAQHCKASATCVTSAEEAAYLDELAAQTRDERKSVKPKFKAEKDDPGFFIVNGVEQAFRADTVLGSEIWFNLDKIYVTEAAGVVRSLPMRDLFELAANVFAVHVPGTLPVDVRTGLLHRLAGIQGQNLIESNAESVGFASKFGAVGYIERETAGQIFSVVVSDHTAVFDQSAAILAGVTSAFDAAGRGPQVIKKSRILQSTWTRPAYHATSIDASLDLKGLIETEAQDGAHLMYRCSMSYAVTFVGSGDGIDKLFLLDVDQSHWTITCNL